MHNAFLFINETDIYHYFVVSFMLHMHLRIIIKYMLVYTQYLWLFFLFIPEMFYDKVLK